MYCDFVVDKVGGWIGFGFLVVAIGGDVVWTFRHGFADLDYKYMYRYTRHVKYDRIIEVIDSRDA